MTAMGGRANDAATENGRLVSCLFRPEGLSNMWESTETGFLLHLLFRVTTCYNAGGNSSINFNDSFDLMLFTRHSAFGAMTF